MPQVGRGGYLDQEAILARVLGQIRPEDLYGNLAVVLAVGGEEDGGHATLAQLTFDGIALRERGLESFQEVGQMWREMGWR